MSTAAVPDPGDWRERLALASARVPFGLKVAVVWIVVFLVIGVFLGFGQFDLQWMKGEFTFIAKGLQWTLIIAVCGIVLAFVLACLGALGRISQNPVAYGVSGFYTSFFRGTPLIVQMFLIYLALPQFAIGLRQQFPDLPVGFQESLTLQPAVAGTLALGLNYGAYMTEIFRAGIQSVSGGQSEAADALGMSYGQKMRKVILPQALRVIIPPTGNEFIAMMKDTALVGFLGVTLAQAEIFRRAQLVGKADFKMMEALLVAAAIYWTLTVVFSYFQGRLEARLAKGYVRTAIARADERAISNPTLAGGEH